MVQPRTLVATAAAVTATAVTGGIGTDVSSRWFARLDKPSWQPPGWLFGPVWTTLYALIAVGTARAVDAAEIRESDPKARRDLRVAIAVNLVLNVLWTWIFFTWKRPRLALAEILLLEASTIDLIRRCSRYDATSGRLLAPYAGWVACRDGPHRRAGAPQPGA